MRGASVGVVDLDADEAREAAERIGPRAIGIAGDVTDRMAIEAAVARTVERFGGLDVAVANAGIAQSSFATVHGIPIEEWERVFEVDMLGVWRTIRAALPQVVDRRGHVVVIGSIYSTLNGLLNSPYAVAKAGVESLGRTLRSELTPLGASASVAYFGWVDTRLVQEGFDQAHASRLEETMPSFSLRRIEPGEAAAALVRGIEERAPRIFAPRWWRYFFVLRGILNPLLDRRFETDRRIVETVREIEAAADGEGSATSARSASEP